MKHTPGPWEVSELRERTTTGDWRDASYIEASAGWANSGMAGKRTVAIVGHWKDRPNPQADARLIAAAPELLEALENLVGLCEAGDGSEEYHRHEPQEMKDARAAIKKARGE